MRRTMNKRSVLLSNFFSSLNRLTSVFSDVVICQPPCAFGASSGKQGVLKNKDDNDYDNNDNGRTVSIV